MRPANRNILTIKDLKTHFFTEKGIMKAVDGINLEIGEGVTLGLVGESGSGKSVTALSIMRLIPYPGRIVGGEVLFDDKDLLKISDAEMRHVRGARISMIFQDPTASLNPVINIGEQIAEVIRLHEKNEGKSMVRKRVIEMMEKVGVSDALVRYRNYPHQFSGGMKQRVMIAIALSCHPEY